MSAPPPRKSDSSGHESSASASSSSGSEIAKAEVVPRRDPDKAAAADDALEAARSMPPGPERMAALKKAGLLRHALGLSAIVIPRKGRPPK